MVRVYSNFSFTLSSIKTILHEHLHNVLHIFNINDWMLCNEELRDLYSSLGIIRIIKSRRMRWAGHVARMGKKRNLYRLLVGKPEGKNH
jgi:hypothetical protein